MPTTDSSSRWCPGSPRSMPSWRSFSGSLRPWRSRKSANCLPTMERPVEHLLVDDRDRQHGDDAHHRPDLHRDGVPVRREQPVVVEPVGVVPDALAVDRVADGGEVLEELQDEVVGRAGGRCGTAPPRCPPWRSRRTPSSRWRRTAPACRPTGRWERSIGPMLSSPRNPPSNRLLPSASSRLTHQVKLTSSLSKTRLRKSRSRPPSMANTSSAAHACTGGLTSPKSHS